MKWITSKSRYAILWAVIVCYLVPFIGLSAYSALVARAANSLHLLAVGLLLSAVGSLAMLWLLWLWQKMWRLSPPPASAPVQPLPAQPDEEVIEDSFPFSQEIVEEKIELEGLLQEMQEANLQLQLKLEEFSKQAQDEKRQLELERERHQQQAEQAFAELDALKQSSYAQLAQQKNMIAELQEVIAENKASAEKKQQQISQLETKVSDMRYEIRTLLHLAEAHQEPDFAEPPPVEAADAHHTRPPPMPDFPFDDDVFNAVPEKQICTGAGASLQLRRCLDIAQKITGSNRFRGQLTSFLDSPSDGFTIDLRRLCDSLRSENNSCILLYSPKENQLLFANNQVKALTGWSPEKFVQDFFDILQDSAREWRQGLSSLSMKSEAQIKLSLKTKNGQDIAVRAHLGLIPTGIFRQHAIAVLYPAI